MDPLFCAKVVEATISSVIKYILIVFIKQNIKLLLASFFLSYSNLKKLSNELSLDSIAYFCIL